MMSKAYLVFSLHDPELHIFPLIEKITPLLKKNFDGIFMSITPMTETKFKKLIESKLDPDFFHINYNKKSSFVGDHHLSVYKNALKNTKSQDFLHLCTPDRLIFSVEKYQDSFFADLLSAEKNELPTLFVRSQKAWDTHPVNYHAVESMATRLGEILFDKTLDFAWCHLSLRSSYLNETIHKIKSHDLTIYAEMIYYLMDKLKVKTVDWLAWEDPFILGKNPEKLKKRRESDKNENEKRLSYILPIIKFLLSKNT